MPETPESPDAKKVTTIEQVKQQARARKPTSKGTKEPKAKTEPLPKLADIPVPDSIRNMRVTAKSLSKGTYPTKVAAHFAPLLLVENFQALAYQVRTGNTQAMRMVNELYELVQTNARVSIINDNRVDNRSVSLGAGGEEGGGGRNFESIMRMFAEEREKRAQLPGPAAVITVPTLEATQFEDTPEGLSK
jgi:hypothetical protein